MVPTETFDKTLDPVELLHDAIAQAWHQLCDNYDVTAECPDMRTLFEGADLSRPDQSAQMVVVNMLMEVTESIGRFSPWYTKPARAFGLTSMRDAFTNQVRWMLAPEAVQRWQDILEPLAVVIKRFRGLVRAILLVDDLMADPGTDDPCVVVSCNCVPPRTIRVNRSILEHAQIVCDTCHQPFY